MRDARGASSSIIAGLLCLIVLAAYAGSVSAGRLTHGFVSYHTAAQLLLEGQMGPQVYDFAWFQQQVQRRTATGVLEIFGPESTDDEPARAAGRPRSIRGPRALSGWSAHWSPLRPPSFCWRVTLTSATRDSFQQRLPSCH